MAVNPSLVALWLVDEVERDEQTGRTTLRGIFNQIVLSPGEMTYSVPFTVFFSVTDVPIRSICALYLVDLSDLQVIYERPVLVEPVEPNEVMDMPIRVNQVPISHSGVYAWELYHDHERLGCTRLVATVGN